MWHAALATLSITLLCHYAECCILFINMHLLININFKLLHTAMGVREQDRRSHVRDVTDRSDE